MGQIEGEENPSNDFLPHAPSRHPFPVFHHLLCREKEREKERERHTHTERKRRKETERERLNEREIEKASERERERLRARETEQHQQQAGLPAAPHAAQLWGAASQSMCAHKEGKSIQKANCSLRPWAMKKRRRRRRLWW